MADVGGSGDCNGARTMARSESSPPPELVRHDRVTAVPRPRRSEPGLSDDLEDLERADGVALSGSATCRPESSPGAPVGVSEPEFRDYVQARRRALLRTAYLLTRNEADAEDLVQSALAKTYLAAGRIADRTALDGYVRRALVNTHISSWRRRRRVVELPTDELPDEPVADHAVSSDLQATLRRAVDRLPVRMRAAVTLRYYHDMTEAEVAELLGVSLGTVKSTVARAVAKLRIDADLQSG